MPELGSSIHPYPYTESGINLVPGAGAQSKLEISRRNDKILHPARVSLSYTQPNSFILSC